MYLAGGGGKGILLYSSQVKNFAKVKISEIFGNYFKEGKEVYDKIVYCTYRITKIMSLQLEFA